MAAMIAIALHTIWRTAALSQPGLAVGDVDAVDHRDAEPVEHGGDRQDERVGVAARRSASRCACPKTRTESPAPSSTSVRVDAPDRAELHEHDRRRR